MFLASPCKINLIFLLWFVKNGVAFESSNWFSFLSSSDLKQQHYPFKKE